MKPNRVRNIKTQRHPNLANIEGTAGNSMIQLIQNADQYKDINLLREDFISAINNTSKISERKRKSYILNAKRIIRLKDLLFYITNIFCAADNLELDWN